MKLLQISFLNLFFLIFSRSAYASTGGQSASGFMVIPFITLLLFIAFTPLINKHWWEKKYPLVSFVLGGIVISYYLFILRNTSSLLHVGLEYVSFIALVGSLYVITGCIHLKIDKKATPLLNCLILLFGAMFANLVGTTGASAFLIRSYLKINKGRIKPYHTVFFIFIVSNIGGSLTPIGDPPLFLGYLKGVPFFWTVTHLWYIWAFAIIALLSLFYVIDLRNKDNSEGNEYTEKIVITGKINFAYLGIVLFAVFIPSFLGDVIGMSPALLLSAFVMVISATSAYMKCDNGILKENEFDFDPIKEVAILFFGIFSSMLPALQWLEMNAGSLGINTAGQFYWGTGTLSAILDNAPTYLNFLTASFSVNNLEMGQDMNVFITEHRELLQAISAGSVFFGAVTYIGNAPNFMIKSISEQYGAEVPSFIDYIGKYSFPILIPLYTVIWLIFF